MIDSENNFAEENSQSEDIANQKKIIELFEKRFKIQEQTLTTLADSIQSLKDDSPKELKILFNMAGYINLVSYDIKIISRDIILNQDEWQRRHYARQACLIIYEAINDLFELLGKDFKSTVKTIETIELKEEIKKIRSTLNDFKKEHSLKLYNIRNTCVAHRDKESLKQLSAIIQTDWNQTFKITIEFENILRSVENFIQHIFQDIMKKNIKK